MGSIAEFAIFDSHTFDPLVEELIVIATSTINDPTIDEVDPLVLPKVVSNPSNIEHLVPTSTPPSQIDTGSNVNVSLPSTSSEHAIDIGQSNINVHEDPNVRHSKRQRMTNISHGYSTSTSHKKKVWIS